MSDLLSDDEIAARLATVPDWSQNGTEIRVTYRAPSFPAGIALVDAVAEEAERMNHHPDIDIRWRDVTFVLSTHSAGGLTANDFVLAAEIDHAAARLGAHAEAP